MWRLFPQFRGFRASFGVFCSCLRDFSATASIPWLRLWCGLFWLRLPVLRLSLSCGSWPCGFLLRHPISGGPCVCVWGFLRWRSCVFFLSSCSGGVGYCCASYGVAFVPLPAAPVVFHGVSCRRLPFGGFRNLSGSSCLSYSCFGALLWGLQCLWCVAWFSTLCRVLPPGPAVCADYPATGCPWGVFCLFCHRVPDLLLLWWRRLGGNPSLILSVLLLYRLACRGLLGSAPCVRELPLGLCLLFG